MAELPQNYDHKTREKHWQQHWLQSGVYHWRDDQPRAQTYVIDTPPPTVSGLLHMGHIFSYTQADFIARYQRMKGMDVFYPMGFDDNGLPTERLVEKTKKIRATDMSREDFIAQCMGVSEEARAEFRRLFESTALSVDWRQEYHTISEESRRISQMSFLDLFRKGEVYRKLQPMLWDPVDQTAIAQAEVEDKELPSFFNDIYFEVVDAAGNPLSPAQFGGRKLKEDGDAEAIIWRDGRSYMVIGTTRPELIPACVGVFFHSEDTRYAGLEGCTAITPLFGVKVPIKTDDTVEPEKGTGIMMCCTFGDEKDIEKWRKHDLPTRVVLNKYGKMDFSSLQGGEADAAIQGDVRNDAFDALQNLKVSNPDPKHPGARQKILEMLRESGDLIESRPITHAVKCAERSGAPLEILPTYQWFVKVLDKKEALKEKAAECHWHPEWMKIRMDQWIDGLNWDWCISRQRYFGVPFPVWYVRKSGSNDEWVTVVAKSSDLPTNPLKDLPKGLQGVTDWSGSGLRDCVAIENITDLSGNILFKGDSHTWLEVLAEPDVMDTWATSSVSPQLSSKGINASSLRAQRSNPEMDRYGADAPRDDAFPPLVLDAERHAKLFPANLRPQAHEIIRTWAFYTLVKAYLHEGKKPWENLMISGWCLAADKTKMSKSKGNVVTPVELIEEKGTDAVRYWASTSRLGADTAFSEDLLKIGRKLTTKLWNAAKLSATLLEALQGTPTTATQDAQRGIITETLDKWLIAKLYLAIEKATKSFEAYEYADARAATEDWFWNDFCDNYLELVKTRAYGNDTPASQQSALYTIHHCLNAVLKLFAPFIPHVTEELFSHLYAAEYAEAGSLHARGMWPNWMNYQVFGQKTESGETFPISTVITIGVDCVSLLNAIRKAKSERNYSIKFPLERVVVSAAQPSSAWSLLPSVAFDLKGAGNVMELTWSETPVEGMPTEDGRYTLALTFAEQTDAA
jgi:valyl-tRNA synthetase